MAFNAYEFTFNGKSCRQFGLILCDLDGNGGGDPQFPSTGAPQMEKVPGRPVSLLRVREQEDTLTFPLTFGLCPERMERRKFLDRYEIEAVAAWLEGGDGWGVLTFSQLDLGGVHYRCIITELRTISSGWQTYGFTCNVVCDSPYAYLRPREYSYLCDGILDVSFSSRSSAKEPYAPKLVIETGGTSDISVVNRTDGGCGPCFTGLPAISSLKIVIDNSTGVIVNSEGRNLYPHFNFECLRLMRGDNNLQINGKCRVTLQCAFPVNMGG